MVKEEIIKKTRTFIDILEARGLIIDKAYLYGSYATGRAHEYSDIDVAIVSNDFTGDISADTKIIFPALRQTDSRIETVRYKSEDFRDEDPLVWEITRKGIRIK